MMILLMELRGGVKIRTSLNQVLILVVIFFSLKSTY
jgi:hypothetical protein